MRDFHHAHLMSTDLDASIKFYEDAFGGVVAADVRFAKARNVFMRVGQGQLHFYEQSPNARGPVNHLGMLVTDLDDTIEDLTAAGYIPRDIVEGAGGRYVMVEGPDAVLIEVFEPDANGMSGDAKAYFFPNSAPETPGPLTTGIDHIGLTVPDLDASVAFFVEALGWKQVGGNPDYPAAYVSDGSVMATLWSAWSDNPVAANRETSIGLHHLAFRVASREALDAVFAAATAHPGVTAEFAPQLNPVAIGPRSHCMVFEPGGNRIEFVHDPR